MYWNERNPTPSTSGSSESCFTPPTPSFDLPPSPFSKDSWPTTHSQTTKEVLQTVLRVRKTWKTLRGGETVWPPELEAALLEGLELYQPDDSRETRMLGRFPRRNRFISDYIFDKTGKRRTPKQVGSRLQQLRESCGGNQLLHLLSPFRKPASSVSSASTGSAMSSPSSPLSDGLFPSTSSSRHIVMYIDILPDGSPDRTESGRSSSPWSDNGDVIRASDHPRRLQSINPTISFTSLSPLVAHSRFTVYSEDLILHAETVPLAAVVDHAPHAGLLYTTKLVPKYWQVLLDSPDPTRFTIFQEVLKEDNSTILFSATYKFSYSSPRYTLQPAFGRSTPQPTMPCDIATYEGLTPFPTTWNAPLLNPRGNSPLQSYPSPSSDSSSLLFPGDLSHYVI